MTTANKKTRKPVDFDTVREIALALPDVEESTSRGTPSFKVRGRLLTCEAIHSSAEKGSLVVHIDFALRAELIETEPDVYYLTPHYENYPAVLVRLARVSRKSLEALLGTACLFVGSKAERRRATKKKRPIRKRSG